MGSGGLVLNLRHYGQRLRDHLVHLLESPTDELGRLGRIAVYQIRLWRFCGRHLVQDRLMTEAGDITFKTLLGLIPALVIFLLVINFFSRPGDRPAGAGRDFPGPQHHRHPPEG